MWKGRHSRTHYLRVRVLGLIEKRVRFLEFGNLTKENVVDRMLEGVDQQWNLVDRLVRGIMSRKSIESMQDIHGLDAAHGNE